MDEELKTQIIPIIESTKEGLAKAVDFLCEQSPILVKEILWWHGVSNGLLCIASVVLFWILYRQRRKALATFNKAWENDEPLINLGIIFGYCGPLVALPFVFISSLTWLKILIAPRLFLLVFMKNAIT